MTLRFAKYIFYSRALNELQYGHSQSNSHEQVFNSQFKSQKVNNIPFNQIKDTYTYVSPLKYFDLPEF